MIVKQDFKPLKSYIVGFRQHAVKIKDNMFIFDQQLTAGLFCSRLFLIEVSYQIDYIKNLLVGEKMMNRQA
jgi:hypothetical protein